MRLAVDRIEESIVVCQNLETKEMVNISKSKLNFKVNDGDILIYKDSTYYKDDNLKNERIKMIQEKFNKSKNI